jgi:hypothetical protein
VKAVVAVKKSCRCGVIENFHLGKLAEMQRLGSCIIKMTYNIKE